MKKSILKTFVYSFVFSLLVILSINKTAAYSSFKKDKTPNTKLAEKSIASFVKKDEGATSSYIPQETEQEALSDNLYTEESESADEYAASISELEYIYDEETDTIRPKKEIESEKVITIATEIAPKDESENKAKEETTPSVQLATVQEEEKLTKDEMIVLSQNNTVETLDAFENISEDLFSEPVKEVYEEPVVILPIVDIAEIDASISSTQEVETAVSTPIKEVLVQEEVVLAQNLKIEETPAQENNFIPIQKNNLYTDKKATVNVEADANQLAMTKGESLIKGLTSSNEKEERHVANEDPWVVAKGNKFANNQMTVEEFANRKVLSEDIEASLNTESGNYGEEIMVAEMVRNILIPIPDEILNDENLTPQLISSDKNKRLQEKVEQVYGSKKGEDEDKKEESKISEGEKKTIFSGLGSIFSKKPKDVGVTSNKKDYGSIADVYKVKKGKDKKETKTAKILPTEMKLSFQPNRAEISGQTLKWIEAFANKTVDDKTVGLEIRIDGTGSFELQKKRLGLLHSILNNRGVEYNKINTVFTTREPNSFIIRTVRLSENAIAASNKTTVGEDSTYYQTW